MSTDLVRFNPSEQWAIATRVADAAAHSGHTDQGNAASVALRILYGMELGMGPAEALNSVHVVKGKPSFSAAAIAKLIKQSQRYDYAVRELTDESCTIVIYDRGEPCAPVTFTMDDAKRAGLAGEDTWKKYPKNKLFARAITNASRWHCPDVVGGAIGGGWEGEIDTPSGVQFDYPPREDADSITGEVVDDQPDTSAALITELQRKRMFAIAKDRGWEKDAIRGVVHDVTGTESTAQMTRDQYEQVIDRLESGPGEAPVESFDSAEDAAWESVPGAKSTDPDDHEPPTDQETLGV